MQGLRPTKAVLGLDIGAGAVKVVELTRGAVRSSALSLRLSAEDASRGSGAGAIQDALRQAAPRARRAVVGLDEADVTVHRFALPKGLPPAETEEQARLQAGQAAPFPLGEAAFDYVAEAAGGHTQGFRMAIARSATVEALCRTVRLTGLSVAAVDVTAFAVRSRNRAVGDWLEQLPGAARDQRHGLGVAGRGAQPGTCRQPASNNSRHAHGVGRPH